MSFSKWKRPFGVSIVGLSISILAVTVVNGLSIATKNGPAKDFSSPINNKGNDHISEPTGYAAEWEYKGSGLEELEGYLEQLSPSSGKVKADSPSASANPSPSRRLGPGTWLDSNGFWWLFGGQGPISSTTTTTTTNKNNNNQMTPINYLSDLWVYGPTSQAKTDPYYWRLVYRPENDGESPLSAHPDNVLFPLLCGSERSGHLSLFKGHDNGQSSGVEGSNSLFNDDGMVWVSDIPKDFKKIPQRSVSKPKGSGCNWQKSSEGGKRRSCNGTEGLLWTSYICCDACLPDGNTTFDFCPQFSKDPILWCSNDSLMAFQLTPGKTIKSKREISVEKMSTSSPTTFTKIPKVSQQINITERRSSAGAKIGEQITTHISPTSQDLMKNENNPQGVGQTEKAKESTTTTTIISPNTEWKNKDSMELGTSNDELLQTAAKDSSSIPSINLWKFDLALTEWVKMPTVNINEVYAAQFQSGNCRSVSDQNFLYILCPTKTNLLERSVLLFDPVTSSVSSLGTIQLNNAFHDKKVWQKSRSVLHALRKNNQTVIMLAYHKLLDLWIHDHALNTHLIPVENVWKGSSLHAFQHTVSFYKLAIVLPNPSLEIEKGKTQEPNILYMINPRSKLFTFQDPFPDGYFEITIVTDRLIFLPSRDAPMLINATDSLNNSSNAILEGNNVEKETFQRNILTRAREKNKMPVAKSTQDLDLEHQRNYSQISNANNNTKPLVLVGESSKEKITNKEKEDKTKSSASEGQRMVGGSGKSHGLSLYINKTTNYPTERDLFNSSMGKGAGQQLSRLLPDSGTSQSKPSLVNYNKTNNSQLKATVEVIPGSKNKRILGIKRTIPETTKIDAMDIGGRDSTNEVRSLSSTGSLPVNNERTRKKASEEWSGESEAKFQEPVVLNVSTQKKPDHPSASANEMGRNPKQGKAKLSGEVNFPSTPQPLKVVPGNGDPENPSLPANLKVEEEHDDEVVHYWNNITQQNLHLSSSGGDETVDVDDEPNLENNYVSSRRAKERESGVLMNESGNESFMGDMAVDGRSDSQNPSSSEEAEASSYTSYSTFGSLIFFSLSLTIFASFGLFVFVRRCVRCPPRDENVLIKDPPPIRYSEIVPDELPFHHTPLV